MSNFQWIDKLLIGQQGSCLALQSGIRVQLLEQTFDSIWPANCCREYTQDTVVSCSELNSLLNA